MNEEEKLAEIKQLLDQGQKPSPVSVRTFLSWFNAQRRGWWVVKEINEMLDYYGIATHPYFDAVYIDSPIEFIKKPSGQQPETTTTTTSTTTTTTTTRPPENVSLVDGEDVLNYNDPTYRIAKLEAANKSLIFCKTR